MSHSLENGSGFSLYPIGFRDINLNYLPPEDKAKFKRMKKLHLNLPGKNNTDRAKIIFKNIINEIKPPPNIKTKAATIFLKSLKKKLAHVHGYEAIIGAAIFIACGINKHTESITEISEKISISKNKIFRCYQLLIKELDIKVNIDFKPEEFVPRICSRVKAHMKIEGKAIEIIKKFKDKKNISGKDPKGIAAGAIYFVSEREHRNNPQEYKKITQKELSSAGGVATLTVRNRYKEIEQHYF